jgi:GNAT superfamily N-acetyltransferase
VKSVLTFAKRIRSKIGCFPHPHLNTNAWLVFEQVLSEWQLESASKLELSSGPVSRDEFLKYAQRFREIVPSADARFASGDLCFGALIEGKYVHLKWVGLNRWYDPDTERYIQLGSDSAYVYDGYTLPEYRGLGLTSVVLDKTFQYLSKIGIKKVYSLIANNNRASLRVKLKENARKIGTVRFVRIFGLNFLTLNSETREDYKKLITMFSGEKCSA